MIVQGLVQFIVELLSLITTYPGLKEIVKFICECYAPMVLDVYFEPQLYNGSVHLFNYLKRTKACLSQELYDYTKEYFLGNGAFFHPENLLVCGLLSPYSTPRTKELALEFILKARNNHKDRTDVRKFTLPEDHQIRDNVRNFFTVLDWRSLDPEYVTPPPVLSIYTDEELRDYNNLVLPNFKNHNQECERVMQDIENSVGSNIGHEKQKASLICTSASRNAYNYKKFKKDDFYE